MGINAIEWAAYSEKADLNKLNQDSLVSKNQISEAQEKQTYSLANYEAVAGKLADTQTQIEDEQAAIEEATEDIATTKEEAEQDIEEEKLSSLSQEITVDKFCPDQGMNCGMGMGMGDTYTSEGAITLTVEELNALDGVLADFSEDENQTDNSEKIAAHLNSTLTSGATATAGTNDDGTKFVQIKRANGSCVKICDANGNGALDVKDYAFCDAIKEAKEVIEKMNSKVEQIQTTAQSEVDSLVDKRTVSEENVENLQAEAENLEGNELPNAETEISNADEEFELHTQENNEITAKIQKQETEINNEDNKDNKKENNNFFANSTTNPITNTADNAQDNNKKKVTV